MTRVVDVQQAFRIFRSEGVAAVALQGLSAHLCEGEIVVVLGPSGSGKTTLLRVLGGFESLSAGRVQLLGTDLAQMSPRELTQFRAQHLGLLDQHYACALSPHLSCVQSVSLTLELLGVAHERARTIAADLLQRVGLADRVDARPSSLSGGEQQRVALCASLVHRPRLLLADEPGGELDATSAEIVYGLIAELVREEGGSALIVSHDAAAASIADRLIFIRDGRVVEESAPGDTPRLVVTEPGWIRIPDSLLSAMGQPRRFTARLHADTLELTGGVAEPVSPQLTRAQRTYAHSTNGSVVAELRNVSRRFATLNRPVLHDLSHQFGSGGFHAIVGRSGSGKTTLLHLVAGLDRPDDGEVLILGQRIQDMTRTAVARLRQKHIALVTQEPGLVAHLSARENVELALQVRATDEDAETQARQALIDVGLGDRLDHRADQLSAGERQRVAIARAVAARPTILLADEPTARLDHENARAVGELLSQLAYISRTAVICATHDETLIDLADTRLTLAEAATSGVDAQPFAGIRQQQA